MKNKLKILILLTIFTASCAQEPLIKDTDSGYAERIVMNASVDDIRNRLINVCTSNGMFIQEFTENLLICAKTTEGTDAILATMAIGNSYSTTPEHKVQFMITNQEGSTLYDSEGNVLYATNDSVKIVARQWLETQMAFGQINRQELNSNRQRNELQLFLDSL